jgi:hypothetical protein
VLDAGDAQRGAEAGVELAVPAPQTEFVSPQPEEFGRVMHLNGLFSYSKAASRLKFPTREGSEAYLSTRQK